MRTVKELQEFLGVEADGLWGPKSQAELDNVLLHPVGNGEYSTRFLKMIPFLWQWEGTRFEDDPDDPGGATKFGIDKRSHPGEDIRNLTEERAIAIYWKEYWQRYGCEQYDYPFGEVIFNCCVNAGWGRVQAIKATGADSAESFLREQEDFYRRLAEQRPRSQKYLKGWLNRTAALRKHLGMT